MKFKFLILVSMLLIGSVMAGVHSQKAKGSPTECMIENQDAGLEFHCDATFTEEVTVKAPMRAADETVFLAYRSLKPDAPASSINDPPDIIGQIGQKIALIKLRC